VPLQDSYDRLASTYDERLWNELDGKSLDRWLLDRVAREAPGLVLDVGCGPGHVTEYLAARGARARGLDLSPGMIEVARARVPSASFEVGDLRQLRYADGELGAVVALYSLIHFPREALGAAVAELARALKPGGLFLAAVHAGTESLRPPELWGVAIDIEWNFLEPEQLFGAVAAAGLAPLERMVRWPYDGAEHESRRVYVLAQKR
jgi:SAM-dependent methyltransferase